MATPVLGYRLTNAAEKLFSDPDSLSAIELDLLEDNYTELEWRSRVMGKGYWLFWRAVLDHLQLVQSIKNGRIVVTAPGHTAADAVDYDNNDEYLL